MLFPLTEEHYFALHGRPESLALLENAREWLRRNNLLLQLALASGIEPGVDQLSRNHLAGGWRPPGVNARTRNAAIASTHLTCEGGDIQDHLNRRLAIFVCGDPAILDQCELWLEDPRWTAGTGRGDPWLHTQIKPPRSGNRIYIPSSKPSGDPDFYARNGLMVPSYLA